MADAMTCPICGAGIAPKSKTGRPAIYCSVGCRRASEYELRRLQARLIRLEDEAEACRRDRRTGLTHLNGATQQEHAADVAREIQRAQGRLRELLAHNE
jgi:hypothetical protein